MMLVGTTEPDCATCEIVIMEMALVVTVAVCCGGADVCPSIVELNTKIVDVRVCSFVVVDCSWPPSAPVQLRRPWPSP